MKQALTDIRVFDSLTARLSGSQSPMSDGRTTCSPKGELQTEFCGSTTKYLSGTVRRVSHSGISG